MNGLARSQTDQWISGVAGGLAERFGIGSTLIRILFILGTIFSFGTGVLIYIILWFIMPKAS